MKKEIKMITPIQYSDDLLFSKVDCFINTPRMINSKMKHIIIEKDCTFTCEAILDYCIKKGWCDAVIHEKYKKLSSIIKNSDCIKSSLKKEILSNSDLKNSFDSWHNSLCENSEYGMSYGVWQKFINMTFKYLFCFKDFIDRDNLEIPFSDLHCPIDSVITDSVLGLMLYYGVADENDLIRSISYNGLHGVSWNNINEKQYLQVQMLISDLCKKSGLPSKLIFDFVYWKRSK